MKNKLLSHILCIYGLKSVQLLICGSPYISRTGEGLKPTFISTRSISNKACLIIHMAGYVLCHRTETSVSRSS